MIIPLILIISGNYSAANGASLTPQYYTKDSSPFGTPYADWIKKWWQWTVSLDKSEHPATNPRVVCATKAVEHVSFIVQSYQGPQHYSCTIPRNNAIMVPISTGSCTSIEAHSTKLADLVACASNGDQHLSFKATLDGVQLNNLENNYATTNLFNMTLPKDNFENLKDGTYPTGAGGYFIFLPPLPAGMHNLHVTARVINPNDSSFNYDYDAVYDLNVR